MAKLTNIQIAHLALNAGLDRRGATIAVAVANAESGRDPNAHNAKPPDDSYGLWQINMLGAMGPERRKKYGLTSNAELFNPQVNARVMADLSAKGKNWLPWTTYTRGSYLPYAGPASAAVDAALAGESGEPEPGIGESFNNLRKMAFWLAEPNNWKRIGFFGAGFLIVVVALFKLTGNNELGPVAKKVVKAGKLVVTKKVAKT